MPATLIDDPLGITFVSTARRTDETIRLGKTSNPALAREMLTGLVDLVHPHGRIDEIKTFKQYVTSIRRFVAELTDRGHVGGAANLTRPQLAQYWMAASNAREYKTRRILAAMDDELGVLKPDVRALVDGRHFNPQRRRDKCRTVPYSEQEWQQLQQVCRESIRRSYGGSRATVDPNHTPAIEGDNYLTATTPAQQDAVDTIIENAQADVLRKAQPPIVLTTQETAEFVQRFPDAVRAMRLSDETITALVTTVGQDVFVAACADPMSGLHGPAGKPCPARPWVCLLCPLAIFTPRHAGTCCGCRRSSHVSGNSFPRPSSWPPSVPTPSG
jgi:hypothetical protein